LLRDKDLLPIVPPIVLKISIGINEGYKDVGHRTELVNSMIQTLVKAKFGVTMFQSLKTGVFFIGLQLPY
jgi:hypothetical protein